MPTVLTAGLTVYWPFWLVGIGGVILVVIAVLALLLLKGHSDTPAAEGKRRAFHRPKSDGPQTAPVTLRFFRMGTPSDAKSTLIFQDQWLAVGSGKNADFCPDPQDRQLAEIHCRIRLSGQTLSVAAVEETFVNGVPIRQLGTVPMRSGDLLRVGSREYRVIFPADGNKEDVT